MGTVHTFPYDETPTPTRLIRNCDEVGLFQDLQHNPFEETFRFAVASNDIPQLLKDPLLKTVPEETLNTPRVIPSSKTDSFNDVYSVMEDDEDIIVLSNEYLIEPILPHEHHSPRNDNEIHSDRSSDVEIIDKSEQINFISRNRNGNSSEISNINHDNLFFTIPGTSTKTGSIEGFLFDNTVAHSNINSTNGSRNKEFTIQKSMITGIEESKEKDTNLNVDSLPKVVNTTKASDILYQLSNGNLPAVISGKNVVILPTKTTSKSIQQPRNVKITPKQVAMNNSVESSVKQKLKSLLKNNSSRSMTDKNSREIHFETQNDANSTSSVEDEKREYSRERNRMAQKRCRMKKKKWIMQLKKETECVLTENQSMQVEISSLRAEIAHLKTLLLAHRNCSVTRAMYKADITAIMNNEVSEISEDIEIPICNDDNSDCSKLQITYQKQVNQVNSVNQVNHIHVHVPESSQLMDEMLNLAPNQKHIVQSLNLPRNFNFINSKLSQNKKLICDSKVVPIKPNDRSLNGSHQNRHLSLKANVLTTRNVQDANKTIPGGNKKSNLQVFINGSQKSVSKFAPVNTAPVLSGNILESDKSSVATKVIIFNENFKTGKTNS